MIIKNTKNTAFSIPLKKDYGEKYGKNLYLQPRETIVLTGDIKDDKNIKCFISSGKIMLINEKKPEIKKPAEIKTSEQKTDEKQTKKSIFKKSTKEG